MATVRTKPSSSVRKTTSTLSKKVASKKANVTSKAKLVAQKKIEPLPIYDGYTVTTDPKKKNLVVFGCGAVKVNRKDLLAAAEALENKAFINTMKAIYKVANMTTNELCSKKGIQSLLTAAKLVSTDSYSNGIEAIKNLSRASSGRRSIMAIITIKPLTLRQLAATPEDRIC